MTTQNSENGPVLSIGTPLSPFLPTAPVPAVWVDSIAGIPLPANPTGSFEVPTTNGDVQINSGAPVHVVIKAKNIALSSKTKVKLFVFSLEGPDQTINDSSPTPMPALQGTFEDSQLSVDVTFPPGFSRGYVTAKW